MKEKILEIVKNENLSYEEKVKHAKNLSLNAEDTLIFFELMLAFTINLRNKEIESELRYEAKLLGIPYKDFLNEKITRMKKLFINRKIGLTFVYVTVGLNILQLFVLGYNSNTSKILAIISLILSAFSYFLFNKNYESNLKLLDILNTLKSNDNV